MEKKRRFRYQSEFLGLKTVYINIITYLI